MSDPADADASESAEEAELLAEADAVPHDEASAEPPELDDHELVDESPAPGPATAALPSGEVSLEDRDFIRRVFTQVKDVDFRSPPPPPPRGLTGPDKKLNDLRERVRRLERELARVGYIWTSKQQQVETLDTILDAKEAERAKAVQRALRFKHEASRLVAHFKQESEATRALLSTITARKVDLEESLRREQEARNSETQALQQQLAQEAQDKAALLADCRGKIDAAQGAFNQLREQSARAIQSLEAQVQTQSDQLLQGDEKLMARDRTITQLADKLTEREQGAAQMAEDMARLREQAERRVNEQRDSARDAETTLRDQARLADEEARGALRRVEDAAREAATVAEREAARLQRELSEARGESKRLQDSHSDARAELKRLQDSYDQRGGELKRLHESYDQRGGELKQLQGMHDQRVAEVKRLQEDHDRRGAELKQLQETHEQRVQELERLKQPAATDKPTP